MAGFLASTDGTACIIVDPVRYSGLPGVLVAALSVLAQPPDCAIGATRDSCWSAATILGGVPLRCQVWMGLSQGGLPCAPQPPSSMVRGARCTHTLQITQAAHEDEMFGGEEVRRSVVR